MVGMRVELTAEMGAAAMTAEKTAEVGTAEARLEVVTEEVGTAEVRTAARKAATPAAPSGEMRATA